MYDVDLAERRANGDFSTDFSDVDVVDAWGVSRSPRNADRPRSRVPAAFDVVEKGLFNFLVSVGAGKGEDDASDVM
eukprot:1494535-Pyramimonas_sp.AAC.1